VTPILATKLYIPQPRPNVVSRPRLLERLNRGQHRKLTLISAPAGFGKTTLVSTWIASLEAGDLRLEMPQREARDLRREASNALQASSLKSQAPRGKAQEGEQSEWDAFVTRLTDSVEQALRVGEGMVLISIQPPAQSAERGAQRGPED